MESERTVALIKPDAVAAGNIGGIIAMIENAGFKIVAMKMLHLTKEQAMAFYYVHAGKPFYHSLCNFMSSGRIVAMVLEAPSAIAKWRELMGPTDPKDAPIGTVRAKFGTDKEKNAVHGSDSKETADFEIAFFFSRAELV